MENPNYYAIMPANIRYDKNLKPMEKILYAEITALTNSKGYCFATNQYFADLYDVHKNTVGNWINHLAELGYLNLTIIYKENSKEIAERRIYICNDPINKKIDTPINEKIDTYQQKDWDPINENVEDNNININNINIIKESKEANPSSFSDEKIKVIPTSAYYQEIKMLLANHNINYENIARMGKPILRIKEVLSFAEKNNKGDGWIVGAIRDNYNLENYNVKKEVKNYRDVEEKENEDTQKLYKVLGL